jgi:hypothetical protein
MRRRHLVNLGRDILDWSKDIWHALKRIILSRSSSHFIHAEQSTFLNLNNNRRLKS